MALWTPANLTAGPLRWHRADSLSLTNGAAISTWTDEGSAAAALTSGSAKPTFITGAYNGLPTVRRTAVTQKLTSAANVGITGSALRTVFVVGKKSASSPNANILGWGAGSGNGLIFDLTWYGNEFIAHAYGGGFDTIGGVQTVDTSNLHVMAARYDAGVVNTWVDGGAKDSVPMTLNTVAGPLMVGGGNYAALDGQPGTVDLCEVLIFNYALSDAEAQMVEGYLAHRWGTVGFLPAAHPYKSSAPESGEVTPGPTVGPIPAFLSVGDFATGVQPIPVFPAGISAGDVVILLANSEVSGENPNTIDVNATGWTMFSDVHVASTTEGLLSRQGTLWWRRLDSSVAPPRPRVINSARTGTIFTLIAAFRGCVTDGVPLEGVSGGSGRSTDFQGREIVSTGINRLAVQAYTIDDNSVGVTTPAGWTQAFQLASGAGNDAAFCVDVKPIGAGVEPGAIRVWGGGEHYTSHGFALIPVNGRQAPEPQPTRRLRRPFQWH